MRSRLHRSAAGTCALFALACASPASPVSSAAENGAAQRTLSEIPIEGEVQAPRVLFITGKDQRRDFDFLMDGYLNAFDREAGAGDSAVAVVTGWRALIEGALLPGRADSPEIRIRQKND